ncbi:MAG: hypothetical protein GXO30_02070 [Epsilonproteobacteria bacterium]|nr:hypothetical protein [Campylobacterota bacterium]
MLFDSIDEIIKKYTNSSQELLLLVAEHSDFEHSKLSNMQSNICGAIFPQIIYQEQNYDNKIMVVELDKKTKTLLTPLKDFHRKKISSDIKDLIVFVDGLSSNIDIFLESLYESTPVNTNIIGAGAGKMTLKQDKVLFTKNSIVEDSALILISSIDLSISAKHGWQKIAGPFIANDVKKNILYSVDYRDAFELYKEVIENDSKLTFNENNFFDIAKSYPLGIVKLDDEILVRDPIALKANSLILVGDMDKNSVIYILKGKKDSLINSAKLATKEAISGKDDFNGIFIVNCISRVLFLEDDFQDELKAIKNTINQSKFSMFGVISLGEIANTNRDYINFYNKTCVIGAY